MRLPDYVGLQMIAVAIGLALYESGRPPRRMASASQEQARDFYFHAIDKESDERHAGVKKFRSSPWSQADEFHNKEASFVREYARTHHVAVSSIVLALDRGMHENWPTPPDKTPDPTVLPCRPRLSY